MAGREAECIVNRRVTCEEELEHAWTAAHLLKAEVKRWKDEAAAWKAAYLLSQLAVEVEPLTDIAHEALTNLDKEEE